MLNGLEHTIASISQIIWPLFLPFIIVVGAYLSFKIIFVIRKQTTEKSKVHLKNVIGPASISLGAMIGTGAIIGVLGSLSSLAGAGQIHLEAMAIWALIGAVVMIPVSYAETLASKIMHKTPKEYIAMLLCKEAAVVYTIGFATLYIFGFGGFQFSGIDAVATIIANTYLHISLTPMNRFLYIIVPVLMVVALIVFSRKHSIFIHSMTYMIATAMVAYFLFFFIFVWRTRSHIPIYISGMIAGMKNPVNAMMGIPLGFIMGMQRVLQTAETGLGALAMAAEESNAKPREAALITLIPTTITVFVSIVVTSYIVSYGVKQGVIIYPADSVERLAGYFATAEAVCGIFGLIVLSLFTLLSALTTLLGSYFFLNQLFQNKEIINIAIYLMIICTAGVLAVFGFNIIFDAVDLLLFIVGGINVIALAVFATKTWKKYMIKTKEG